ncbi:MAG: hypothetical protein ABI539_15340 [Acidobacteriota bacterium]
MKYLIIPILLFCANAAIGQSTFVVDDFSDRYFGKVYISDTSEVFSKGWVAIFDKRTKKQLMKVTADELSFDPDNPKIRSNVKELPYGEQSQIMYEDLNFDGKKDLALMDGQNSCYHGPSFQIYLAVRTGFVRSPAFTRLAQDYCGMFNVDHQTKKINTMTKDGCCWHQYSEFIVKNNRPVAVKIVEEGMNPDGITRDLVEQTLVGGKMRRWQTRIFDAEEQKESTFYSIEFSNGKIMRLVKLDDTLIYVFTDKGNVVELIHDGAFKYSRTENVLSFTREKTTYRISTNGISIKTSRNIIELKADARTLTGSFPDLLNAKLDNVTIQQ